MCFTTGVMCERAAEMSHMFLQCPVALWNKIFNERYKFYWQEKWHGFRDMCCAGCFLGGLD